MRLGAFLLFVLFVAFAHASEVPAPLANNPGNVFLSAQSVAIDAPRGQWTLIDYDGNGVARGDAPEGRANLGELPVGYYELKSEGGSDRISIGVIAPLKAPTSADSPVGIDVAMAWFYKDEARQRAAANLCALAGVNWVRDRLSWPAMEPKPGEYAPPNIYDDTARVQSEAGLRVLQVNHHGPPWNPPPAERFPPDLRDAHRFYREMARRWQGQVLAFEPWNEADIPSFGGHTGAEIAALQKAAYLGLKAGNPDVIAGQNCFAKDSPAILDDFQQNEAWPYFDTYNFHHYGGIRRYPQIYARHRAVSGGKPLWITECNIPVQWTGDPAKKEPSDEALRTQAERVAKIFAASLHEGAAAVFYFILPHYSEGQTQFGILREDLTPRPAYVALAAVGRLLADAKPFGKMDWAEGMHGYVFTARPDGQEKQVVVAWSERPRQLELPDASAAFDHLGRPINPHEITLRNAPVFVVFQPRAIARRAVAAPPRPPMQFRGSPGRIVLQPLVERPKVLLQQSAYEVFSDRPNEFTVVAYNFSDERAGGIFTITGPRDWKLHFPGRLTLEPWERKELTLRIDASATTIEPQAIKIVGGFGAHGRPILSMRFMCDPTQVPTEGSPAVSASNDPQRWKPNVSPGSTVEISDDPDGGVLVSATLAPGDRWVYPILDLLPEERPGPNVRAARFTLTTLEGDTHYRLILVEESGASYVGEPLHQPTFENPNEVIVFLDNPQFGHGWSKPDPNHQFDVDSVVSVHLGGNTRSERVRFRISDFRWIAFE